MAPVFDYEAAAVAFLTLRLDTPAGEWLSDSDLELVRARWLEAVNADGLETAAEYSELAMMNLAHAALVYLAAATGRSEQEWLQTIRLEDQDAERRGKEGDS